MKTYRMISRVVTLLFLIGGLGVSMISTQTTGLVNAEGNPTPTPQIAPTQQGNTASDGFVHPPVNPNFSVSDWTGIESVLPSRWDWRDYGEVTSVKNQGSCGDCYAFAAIGDLESKLLISGAGTYDLSENNVKSCNWYAENTTTTGACKGGNAEMVADVLSETGTVLESCDPHVESATSCNTSCGHQYSLTDMRVISGSTIPTTSVLKNYIMNYGPIYVSMNANFTAFNNYNGTGTLYYSGTATNDHAVVIVGWDDSLSYSTGSGTGTGAWIVKNSWGTNWGNNGYFTIAYGSAGIGEDASYDYAWQPYDSSGKLYYWDDAGWNTSLGYGTTTAWGLTKFTPTSATYATDIEFWMPDSGKADVYLYGSFNGSTLSNLLASSTGNTYTEAGYHSVKFSSPVALTSGSSVAAVVKFTDSSYTYPVPLDVDGPHASGQSYVSSNGTSWTDEGKSQGDISIRLRTSTTAGSKTAQSITVSTAAPSTATYGTQFTVAATASSGLAVTYSSGNTAICTNSGATFTMVNGSGTCVVRFDQAGNGTYAAATQVTESVTAAQASQSISVSTAAPGTAAYKSTFTVAATATSSLALTFTSGSTSVCTVSGSTYTMLTGSGTCVVQINQAGNANYAAATQVTENVTATPAAQTISVGTAAPGTAAYNSTFSVAATASSGLTVTISSGSTGVCTVSGSTFSMLTGTGTCMVQFDQAGNTNYAAASRVTENVTATKATQTISVGTAAPGTAAYNSTFSVAATATSGQSVAISSGSTGVCTVSGSTFTMLVPSGTCVVQFDQAGTTNYAAAPQVVENVTATKASQTISVGTAAPGTAAYNSTFTVAATATSGGTVTYSSGSTGVCTVSGATFTMVASSGTCVVQFDQSGTTNYNAAARVTENVSASKASQTISVGTAAPGTAAYNSTFTVAATATSGGTVAITSGSTSVCTVSGSTFTLLTGSGTCVVQFDQSGTTNYNAATRVTENVTATPAAQTISVGTAAPGTAAYNSTFSVAATATSGLTVAITSGSTGVCTVSGSTFTLLTGTGTCVVQFNQSGSTNYAAASQVTENVTATKASQTISVGTAAPGTAAYNGTFSVAATASSGQAVAISSGSTGVCTVSGSTFTMLVPSGTCVVQFDQSGTSNYAAAPQVVENVAATKASQSINVSQIAPTSAAYGGTFSVAASATSNLTVAITSGSTGVCTVSGSTFTLVSGTGTCVVWFDQAGNANYASASRVIETVTATPATQSISVLQAAPVSAVYNSTFTVSASATSGDTVEISSGSLAVCTVSGSTFTMLSGTGTCVVQFNQAGNPHYGAASQVTETVAAVPASQTIQVSTAAPVNAAYNSTFTVAATATSTLPVTIASGSLSICTVSGSTFTMLVPSGTCVVQFTQGGNANYNAAAPVTQNVAATLASQSITVPTPAPGSAAYNSSFTVVASASSNLAVAYSSGSPAICSVDDAGTFTMRVASGICVVQIDQAGNGYYQAADQVIENVIAEKADQTITITQAPPTLAGKGDSFTVAATSSSGLAVTYSVDSPEVCSISGARVTITAETGSCVVRFSQDGDEHYLAADPVTRTTTINEFYVFIPAIIR